MINLLATLDRAVAAVEDQARGVLWVVDAVTRGVWTVDLGSGALTHVVDLVSEPSGVALSGDGTVVLVAGTDGSMTSVVADRPGTVTVLASSGGDSLRQAAATRPASGPGSALAVSASRQRLLAVSLADGQVRTVLALAGITGVAAQGSRVFTAATVAGSGRLARVSGGATQAVATGLLPTGHVTVSPDGTELLVAHPDADRVTVASLADGRVATAGTDDLPGTVVELHRLADGRLAVLTTEGVSVADDLGDLAARPRLLQPDQPLFVGSWVRLQFDLSGSALTADDVSFVVVDGPEVGFVSHTSTVTGTGGEREVLLVAGGLLGRFTVEMQETSSGAVLDAAEFEVTDHWHDPDNGPSQFLQGDSGQPTPGYDWGGGPNTPQNMGTVPHHGIWRIGVLLVNTADGSYPSDGAGLAAARKAVLDEVQDGVLVDTATRSARHYYEEVSGYDAASGRGLTVRAHNNQVFGPVVLPDGWDSYFAQKKDAGGVVTDQHWSSMGATVQTIVSRAVNDGVMSTGDLSAVDVLLIVPFSPPDVDGRPPNRFVWPHAHSALPFLAGRNPQTDYRTFAYVFVPPDFAVKDGRYVHTTLSHELGHTLGLPDLYGFPGYSPDVTGRLTTGWDLMCGSNNNLPHYSLSNRMRQGWVQAGHLRLFDFAAGGGAVNTDVTLHAAELSPPPGRSRGIEIRLADGWNTYVEYRAKQAAQVGDTLPADRRVVITDVTSESFSAPVARPPFVFVHNDGDGDGPLLDASGDYEDTDPSSQKKLVVTVRSTSADSAVVNVKYGSDGRPDPGIRPWSGPPAWQSPDIEVRNARSQADPGRWANTPWLGNQNTVVAKVRNNGDLLCKGVTVDLFAVRFTSGDGPMVLLGTAVKDVPAQQTIEFSVPWAPRDEENPHFCIVARIRLYQDPAIAGLFETDIYNNEARSNYTRSISASASPSSRVAVAVELANPFEERTRVHAVLRSGHPFHRAFLEHRWLTVDGRSSRPVRVLDEALAGFPEADAIGRERLESSLWKEDNTLSVEGWADRPFQADCGSKTLTGGAALRVGAGRRTQIDITAAQQSYMSGTVVYADDHSPCAGGSVVVVAREDDEFGGELTAVADVRNDGSWVTEFGGRLPSERQSGTSHYLGGFGAAPCDSERVPLEP